METTLGGDRLGSGNKQDISMRNYERSTHDLSYLWRSSMSSGTLVPFMSKVALPGDNFHIELDTEVMTLPTIGPLFGSYKVQLDIFEVPMRLYNAKLHNNKLGVGMDMSNIFIPQIEILANNHANYTQTFEDNEHINPSCLLKYLGISGLGYITGATNPAPRNFNAIALLAYYEIYKNYYSNKQEEIGYIIHSESGITQKAMTPLRAYVYDQYNDFKGNALGANVTIAAGDYLMIEWPSNCALPNFSQIGFENTGGASLFYNNCDQSQEEWDNQYKRLTIPFLAGAIGDPIKVLNQPTETLEKIETIFGLEQFNLSQIDDMRDLILQHPTNDAFTITSSNDFPYSCFMQPAYGVNETLKYACQFSQEGLAIKTYQSDLFNNWINTDWIDGVGGISELTAVDTSAGEFTIDALNIAQKVYIMLNRIAISGGTYDDWLGAVYTHERVRSVESPVYHGSLIKELAFQEVISNASAEDADGNNQPLGQLAGRGKLTGKHKGGMININVNEPAYIIGIVSLTPRVEYSQGNDWDVNLATYDDLHKPALDGIGFQDLITEQMLWSDSELDSATGLVTTKSLGKQPAWINYMTSVNKCYGSFAEKNDSMFMTLNRRFEASPTDGSLVDGTTYIDPTKFNNIFADESLESQNFWVQIAVHLTARRKMSAKIIPNL